MLTAIGILAAWALFSLALLYSTWVHFAAIMRMKALRDAGEIDKEKDRVLWVCGSFMLATGLVMDAALQIIVATPVFLEFPILVKWKQVGQDLRPSFEIEWLTTSRLVRWNRSRSTSWWTRNVRKPMVNLGKVLLDKVDTDGLHIQ